ncbi:MAG TPA: hypothetical protein VH834_18240 [Solirubrobacteraceae bacterium]
MTCPNCTQQHGAEDACFLGLLLGVAQDRRGVLSPAEIARAMEGVDADYLWTRFGGPAVDYVEDVMDGRGS